MRKGMTAKTTHSNNVAITSAAFQDHIARNLLDQTLSSSSRNPVKTIHGRKASADARKGEQRDTGKQKHLQKHQIQEEEREYVLDPAPPRLTLAQKMGLVASPPRRLTVDEWTGVKVRSIRQGDSTQPCVICREEFRLQPQVLLSCSHVFHRACLRAFERFSGRKCCPMCRKEQYETRLVHDAARLFRQQCATRIQACWRGYAARKWYSNVKKTNPPKDPRLRRKFFEKKLEELNDSFLQYCRTDVEAFLSDIDRTLSSSRRVFDQMESERVSEPRNEDWDRIQNQVIQKDVWECAICLTSLCSPGRGGEAGRRTVLLSCSHLFHQRCLEAFESFCVNRRPTCPLCRSAYYKRLV